MSNFDPGLGFFCSSKLPNLLGGWSSFYRKQAHFITFSLSDWEKLGQLAPIFSFLFVLKKKNPPKYIY
jgi:hypothetical protein